MKKNKAENQKKPELDFVAFNYMSPLQLACVEIAKMHFGIKDKNISEYQFHNEMHISISILSARKVKSADKKNIPENGKYFGFLIGPQGFVQTAWISKNDDEERCHWNGDQYFLNHPCEIIDYIKAYEGKPFINKRTWIGDPFKSKDAYIKTYLSGPVYNLPLYPEYQKNTSTLDSLIEDAYLLIDAEPYKGRMIPISCLASSDSGKRIQSLLEDISFHVEPINGKHNHRFRWLPFPESCGHVADSFDEYNNELEKFAKLYQSELPHVSFFDIVCSINSEFTSPQLVSEICDGVMHSPKFVIRPNYNKVSLPRLMDALHVSIDTEHFLTDIHHWKKTIRNIKVDIERDPLDQIRASISHRSAIQEFGNSVAAKIYMPTTIIEPLTTWDFDQGGDPECLPLDLYERRIASMTSAFWKFCEGDYKKLLLDSDPKLPHFLEVAYQKFADSSNEKSLSANSRNLLNMLSRSLLFFMLEDVISADLENDQSKALGLELACGKPPSDGRLLDMIIALIKSVPIEKYDRLVTKSLFSNLKSIISQELIPLVTKRNRANHPPFDENSFLDQSIARFPRVISKLRVLFQNIELLVPIHYKTESNYMVMHARSLTGHHFEYPEKDYWLMDDLISSDLAQCNELYLCNVFPHQSKNQNFIQGNFKQNLKNSDDKKQRSNRCEGDKIDFSPIFDALKEMELNKKRLTEPSVLNVARLNKYFQMREGFKKIIMTGVFDHVSKGQPVFDYIESD